MANEKRLIDANALRERMFSYYSCVDENSSKEYYKGETLMSYEVADMIEDCIDNAPTVDAVEVVYAHWEDGCAIDCYGNIAYKSIDCSRCKEVFKIEKYSQEYWKKRFKACPFCGAVMDGGNEDV